MRGNFWGRAGITLGIISSMLLMLACFLKGKVLLGMWLLLGCLTLLFVVVVIFSRFHKNDKDLDPLNDAGRIARHVKSHKTKPVYENDAGVWDQMTGDKTDD